MPQTFSVTLPDDACEYLQANARWEGKTPEDVLSMWANRMIQLREVGDAKTWSQFYAAGKVPSQCDYPEPQPLTDEELAKDPFLQLAGSFIGENVTSGGEHDAAFAEEHPNLSSPRAKHG